MATLVELPVHWLCILIRKDIKHFLRYKTISFFDEGLVTNTAKDAGNPGPDYKYGLEI